jgi:hypothetical protein
MSQIKVSLIIDEAHLPVIEKVSQDLISSGATVEQVLPSIGVINCSIESNLVDSLKQIDGVKQVEQQQTYQAAPPNSPIQ